MAHYPFNQIVVSKPDSESEGENDINWIPDGLHIKLNSARMNVGINSISRTVYLYTTCTDMPSLSCRGSLNSFILHRTSA